MTKKGPTILKTLTVEDFPLSGNVVVETMTYSHDHRERETILKLKLLNLGNNKGYRIILKEFPNVFEGIRLYMDTSEGFDIPLSVAQETVEIIEEIGLMLDKKFETMS